MPLGERTLAWHDHVARTTSDVHVSELFIALGVRLLRHVLLVKQNGLFIQPWRDLVITTEGRGQTVVNLIYCAFKTGQCQTLHAQMLQSMPVYLVTL